MWQKFKWDMFVTSFIPLWVSIVFVDIWDGMVLIVQTWDANEKIVSNLWEFFSVANIQIISVLVIVGLVATSIRGINSFLKNIETSKNNPKGTIVKSAKANKLSAEFLLAYILPMIAFDFSELKDVVMFLVYFAVLAFLCIRNNNIYTNIFLEFKGYRIYNCDIECAVLEQKHIYHDSLFISKIDLTQEEKNDIPYWSFENYIYITIDGGEK